MTVDNDDNSSVSIDIDFEILNSGVVSSDVPMKPPPISLLGLWRGCIGRGAIGNRRVIDSGSRLRVEEG